MVLLSTSSTSVHSRRAEKTKSLLFSRGPLEGIAGHLFSADLAMRSVEVQPLRGARLFRLELLWRRHMRWVQLDELVLGPEAVLRPLPEPATAIVEYVIMLAAFHGYQPVDKGHQREKKGY